MNIGNNCPILRKIMLLNAVSISKSPNEYHQKHFSKSGIKMDLQPALVPLLILEKKPTFVFTKKN